MLPVSSQYLNNIQPGSNRYPNNNQLVSTQYPTSIQSMYSQYTVSIQSMYSQYPTSIQSMYSQYPTSIQSMYSQYPTSIQSMHSQYTVKSSLYPVSIHSTYPGNQCNSQRRVPTEATTSFAAHIMLVGEQGRAGQSTLDYNPTTPSLYAVPLSYHVPDHFPQRNSE